MKRLRSPRARSIILLVAICAAGPDPAVAQDRVPAITPLPSFAPTAEPRTVTETFTAYRLKFARPAEIAARLTTALQQAAPGTRVVAQDREQQLWVEGVPSAHRIAQEVIQTYDRPEIEQVAHHDDRAAAVLTASATSPVRPTTHALPLGPRAAGSLDAILRDVFGPSLSESTAAMPGARQFTVLRPAGSLQVALHADRKKATLVGPPAAVRELRRLIASIDAPTVDRDQRVEFVSSSAARPDDVRRIAAAFAAAARARRHSKLEGNALAQAQQPTAQPPSTDTPPTPEERLRQIGTGVDVEALPDLDVIILRGNRRDVDEVMRIIQEIERLGTENAEQVDVVFLQHAASDAVAAIIDDLDDNFLVGRQGEATVRPLVTPNAVLIVGWGEAFNSMKELVTKLDQPKGDTGSAQVFRLQHTSANQIADVLTQFFVEDEGLAPRVTVRADERTNSILVQAAPADMQEVARILSRLDVSRGDAVNELRVFRLRNTLSTDLATTLNEALDETRAGGGTEQRTSILRMLTVDAEGRRIIESGLLDDVTITPDARTNALLVAAPAATMDLLEALIEQLDELPASISQVKVFQIVNGDASSLVEMLRSLLGVPTSRVSGPQLSVAEDETALAPLRFSVDVRTNSIIATGSAGDLEIVEAILLRLDEDDVTHRRSRVFRLKNAPSLDVAAAINEFLRSERQIQLATPGGRSPFQQIESEVVTVAEPVSNSLIISATPRYYDTIIELVEDLDRQPPQVLIQVLIAEVELGNTDEFGVEMGLQDSLLFDRSLVADILTRDTDDDGNDDTIVSSSLIPGFLFNNSPLGNSGSDLAMQRSENVGGQGLTSFSVGRVNDDLGFGGLVLAAGSESVNLLIRALRQTGRMEVLSRPQVTTVDNQPAYIQVGQRVPRVINTSLTSFGQVNSVELENVGLILGVTPRISPDGTVVMEVDAEKSAVDPDNGVPVAISNGQEILSPVFDTTRAQTTISAADGQTVILGGLITKSTRVVNRNVPGLSNIPVLGALFRYNLDVYARTELIIILTPHVVRNPADMEKLKQMEYARMHWCLADVNEIHGSEAEHAMHAAAFAGAPVEVVYPDYDPRGIESIPQQPIQVFPAEPLLNSDPQLPPTGNLRLPPVDPLPAPESFDNAAAAAPVRSVERAARAPQRTGTFIEPIRYQSAVAPPPTYDAQVPQRLPMADLPEAVPVLR